MIFLSKVDDVFQIVGRGCVIVPGLPQPAQFNLRFHQDVILLRRPDGTTLETSVQALMFLGRPAPGRSIDRTFIPMLLASDVTKSDVPVGTEVWWLHESAASPQAPAA